jgi:hypothetical protein
MCGMLCFLHKELTQHTHIHRITCVKGGRVKQSPELAGPCLTAKEPEADGPHLGTRGNELSNRSVKGKLLWPQMAQGKPRAQPAQARAAPRKVGGISTRDPQERVDLSIPQPQSAASRLNQSRRAVRWREHPESRRMCSFEIRTRKAATGDARKQW